MQIDPGVVQGQRTVLMLVLQTTPPVVLTTMGGAQLLGEATPEGATRDSAVGTAQRWLRSITRGRLQGTPECFLAGELRRGGLLERVVVCPLRSVPRGFPDVVVFEPARIPRQMARHSMAWAPLSGLANTSAYDYAALTVARLATFERPVQVEAGSVTAGDWAVGARPWRSVQAPVRVGGPGWGQSFADGVAWADAGDAELRDLLLSLPEGDPDGAHLRAMADSIDPVDPGELPTAFREGELPWYEDASFADVPYSARCQPAETAPMAAPEPQPPPMGGGAPPRLRMDELLKEEGLLLLMDWLQRFHGWLLWLLRTPELPGPVKPEVLVLGPSYFTEEALGYIWERGADGLYSHSDLARPIETHLDLDFLCSYREGWPDQEIFGHLCYGVRLKAPGPHQIVLQPHMVSAIGNYDKVQKELARLTEMGWYELCRQVPFLPFSIVQQGTTTRALEPGRPRRTSNFTAPHKAHEDEVGQEVLPVNVAAGLVDPPWAGAGGFVAGLSAPSVPLPRPAHDAPLGVGMHLFSGPSGVAQGLAAESRARGFEVLEIDLEGDPAYDLLDDVVYHALLAAARRGEYQWIVAGIPCNTYSVSLWREDAWSEARPLRGRGADAEGLPDLGADERRKVAEANLLAHRACWLCREVQRSGGVYVIENPVDRGAGPYAGEHWPSAHSPLWEMPCVQALCAATGGERLDFAQCSFGSVPQKITTLLYSPDLGGFLGWMAQYGCRHRRHAEVAVGRDGAGRSRSRRAAAYPPSLNATFARELAAWALAHERGAAAAAAALGVAAASAGAQAAEVGEKFPAELKPNVSEAMNDLIPLENASCATGIKVFQNTSDFKDFFNQAKLARESKHRCGWITLGWAGADVDVGDPVLCFVTEHVIGFGCRVSSGVMQRFADFILHIFRQRMQEEDDRRLQRDPRLAGWLGARRRLSEQTGNDETRLWTCHIYTDDPWFACLGAELMVLILRAWSWVTRTACLIMAIAAKQQVGTCVKWLGVRLAAGLGFAYVTPDKRARALDGLREAQRGRLTIDKYRGLLGLLVHLLFLAGMRRSALYGLFVPFEGGGVAEQGPTTVLRAEAMTPTMLSQLAAWERRLQANSGAPFFAAVPGWRAEAEGEGLGVTDFLRSDASRESLGTSFISGHHYGRYWIHELSEAEMELPIGVTELVGGGGNCAAFGPGLAGSADVVLELDALASPQILSRSRARSVLMQHAHMRIQSEPGYLAIERALRVQHIYGAANAVADAGSRGREGLMRELLGILGCAAQRVATPPFVPELLGELVELRRTLTPLELFLGAERGNEYTGDGPQAGAPSNPNSPGNTPPSTPRPAQPTPKPGNPKPAKPKPGNGPGSGRRLFELLAEYWAYRRSLTPLERFLGPERRCEYTADGPMPGVEPLGWSPDISWGGGTAPRSRRKDLTSVPWIMLPGDDASMQMSPGMGVGAVPHSPRDERTEARRYFTWDRNAHTGRHGRGPVRSRSTPPPRSRQEVHEVAGFASFDDNYAVELAMSSGSCPAYPIAPRPLRGQQWPDRGLPGRRASRQGKWEHERVLRAQRECLDWLEDSQEVTTEVVAETFSHHTQPAVLDLRVRRVPVASRLAFAPVRYSSAERRMRRERAGKAGEVSRAKLHGYVVRSGAKNAKARELRRQGAPETQALRESRAYSRDLHRKVDLLFDYKPVWGPEGSSGRFSKYRFTNAGIGDSLPPRPSPEEIFGRPFPPEISRRHRDLTWWEYAHRCETWPPVGGQVVDMVGSERCYFDQALDTWGRCYHALVAEVGHCHIATERHKMTGVPHPPRPLMRMGSGLILTLTRGTRTSADEYLDNHRAVSQCYLSIYGNGSGPKWATPPIPQSLWERPAWHIMEQPLPVGHPTYFAETRTGATTLVAHSETRGETSAPRGHWCNHPTHFGPIQWRALEGPWEWAPNSELASYRCADCGQRFFPETEALRVEADRARLERERALASNQEARREEAEANRRMQALAIEMAPEVGPSESAARTRERWCPVCKTRWRCKEWHALEAPQAWLQAGYSARRLRLRTRRCHGCTFKRLLAASADYVADAVGLRGATDDDITMRLERHISYWGEPEEAPRSAEEDLVVIPGPSDPGLCAFGARVAWSRLYGDGGEYCGESPPLGAGWDAFSVALGQRMRKRKRDQPERAIRDGLFHAELLRHMTPLERFLGPERRCEETGDGPRDERTEARHHFTWDRRFHPRAATEGWHGLRCIICGHASCYGSDVWSRGVYTNGVPDFCCQCGWRLAVVDICSRSCEALRARCVERLADTDRRGFYLRGNEWPSGEWTFATFSGDHLDDPVLAITLNLVRVGGRGFTGRSVSGPLLVSRDATLELSLTAHLDGAAAVLLDGSRLDLRRTPRELGLEGGDELDLCMPQTGGGVGEVARALRFHPYQGVAALGGYARTALGGGPAVVGARLPLTPWVFEPRGSSSPGPMAKAGAAAPSVRSAPTETRQVRLATTPYWAGAAQPVGVEATFARTQTQGLANSLIDLLRRDESAYAIPQSRLWVVADLEIDIQGLAADGRAYGTRRQQRSNWKHWEAWCSHLGINPWRFDTAANAGVDAAGAKREAFILGAGLRFIFNRMQPRRRSDPTPLPQSALNVLLGVRRLHKDRGFPMVPMPMIQGILKGMMRRVQEEYGEDHPNVLVPKRKEPFTTEILDAIGALPGDTRVPMPGRRNLCWGDVFGRALWAMLCVLCAAGLRKSEVARTEGSPEAATRHRRPIAMRRNAIYRIGGRELACPTAEDFRAMGPGDNVIITPPPSKADQWAMVWGASPIYLAWGPEPRNACRALAAMELGDMVTGEERSRTPLFSPGGGVAFTGYALDTALRAMLRRVVPAAQVEQYSWHSARIYLACSLLDAGASNGQIQAMCRWLSEESLHIYARMNETTYTYWLQRALTANVNSVRATSLAARCPLIEDAQIVGELLRLNLDHES